MANKKSKIRLGKFKRKVQEKKRKPIKKILIAAAIGFGIVFSAFTAVKFWKFQNYKVELTEKDENTLVYNYYSCNGKLLKCASDTAILVDVQNESIWTVNYEMNNPNVEICGDAIAIYDKNGTSVVLCNEKGKIASFNTELPVIKADISEQGTLAVLEDDGSTARIDYFDTSGSLIATVRTTMDEEGYPMDLALSSNGILLGVSYIRYEDGKTINDVIFYNFSTAGQSNKDNIVSSYSYEDVIIPQICFMGEDSCIAFGTDRLLLYRGNKNPQESESIETDGEIKSTFADEDGFGFVVSAGENGEYEIQSYDKKGKKKATIDTDFSYTSIERKNGLLCLYNRSAICIYSADGILKYNGETEFFIRQVRLLESNRYAVAATDGFDIIRLY